MWNDHISASLICMDQLRLDRYVGNLISLGVYKFHADFMDNTLVPRLGIAPEVIKQLKNEWKIEIDSHLMIKNPERCLDVIAPYSDWVTIHYEAQEDPLRVIQTLKKNHDCKVGLAFNVLTAIPDWVWFCEDIDGILLMGISPGVLGTKHYEDIVWKKLLQCRNNYSYLKSIYIDGAVNFNTIKRYYEDSRIGGYTTVVCGSSTLFKGINFPNHIKDNEQIIQENIAELKKCIQL